MNTIENSKESKKLESAEGQINSILNVLEKACNAGQNDAAEKESVKNDLKNLKQELDRSKSNTVQEKKRVEELTKVIKKYVTEISDLRKSQRKVFKDSHEFNKKTMESINKLMLAKHQDISGEFEQKEK